MAICHNNLGQVEVNRGNNAAAREHYQAAVDEYRRLAAKSHPQGLRGLARAQMNLGLLLSADQDPEATAVLEAALDNLLMLAEQAPDDLGVKDQLALCENNLATLALATDLDRAESLLQQAVVRYAELHGARPASPEHLSDQALATGNLAAVIARRGDQRKAMEMLQAVVSIRKMLIGLEPDVLSHHYDLAIAHQQIGQLQITSDQLDEAADAYRQSRRVLDEMLVRWPKNHQILSSMGRAVGNLGAIEMKRGNGNQALDLLQQAAEYQQLAVDLVPSSVAYNELLQHHRERISELRTRIDQESSSFTDNGSEGG